MLVVGNDLLNEDVDDVSLITSFTCDKPLKNKIKKCCWAMTKALEKNSNL